MWVSFVERGVADAIVGRREDWIVLPCEVELRVRPRREP